MSAARNIEEPGSAVAPSDDGVSHDKGLPTREEAVAGKKQEGATGAEDPPLPDEEAPPLPDEPAPTEADDGWMAQWSDAAQAWYFVNSKTGISQWENPRVPEATASRHVPYDRTPMSSAAYASSSGAPGTSPLPEDVRRKWGGYNPAIHGSYDPNADYALEAQKAQEAEEDAAAAAAANARSNILEEYSAQAHFNRFTGKFQQAGVGPDMHNDENKSKRQMTAFFDVDAAANSHDGRSLKEERRKKTLSKKEYQALKAKSKAKQEHRKRAWLIKD